MTLLIDSREKGFLPKKLLDSVENSEVKALSAGDYWVEKNEGVVIIERIRIDDYVSKLFSGRLKIQVEKCREASDDVIFLLEGFHERPYANIDYKTIVGSIASLSRKVRVVSLKNVSESFAFITKLVEIEGADNYSSDLFNKVSRQKVKPKSLRDEAKYALMGVSGIGSVIADKMLEGRSLKELINSELDSTKQEVHLRKVVEA